LEFFFLPQVQNFGIQLIFLLNAITNNLKRWQSKRFRVAQSCQPKINYHY